MTTRPPLPLQHPSHRLADVVEHSGGAVRWVRWVAWWRWWRRRSWLVRRSRLVRLARFLLLAPLLPIHARPHQHALPLCSVRGLEIRGAAHVRGRVVAEHVDAAEGGEGVGVRVGVGVACRVRVAVPVRIHTRDDAATAAQQGLRGRVSRAMGLAE